MLLTWYLGYAVERSQFWFLLAGYAAFFALYVVIVQWLSGAKREGGAGDIQNSFIQNSRIAQRWVVLGIVLRVLLLFSLPNLSNDFYRFLWDGRLIANGIHPFSHPPVYFWENGIVVPGLDAQLYEGLNSARFYTVYPPVCQVIFWLAAVLFPTGLHGGVFVLKLFLLACEIGTIRLLWYRDADSGFAQRSAVWYALNPLAIFEVVGNAHFEGAVVYGMLKALSIMSIAKIWVSPVALPVSALWWALAVASKLLPLLFVPIVWAWFELRRGWYWVCWLGLWCALLFAPLLQPTIVLNMLNSIELYFNQFEFNASGYYIVKFVSIWLTGNPYLAPKIGTWTACLTLIGIAVLSWRLWRWPPFFHLAPDGPVSLQSTLLWASSLYLFFTSTVHPWYVVIPLALGLSTNHWRFPVVWSGVAILSYSHYIGGGLRENFALIGLEYALLAGYVIWEISRPRVKI